MGYAKSSQTPWGRGFDKFTGYLGGSEDYYAKTICQSLYPKNLTYDPNNRQGCGVDYSTEGKGCHRKQILRSFYKTYNELLVMNLDIPKTTPKTAMVAVYTQIAPLESTQHLAM